MTDLELLKSANLYRKDTLTGEEGLILAGILLLGSQQTINSALPHYKTDVITYLLKGREKLIAKGFVAVFFGYSD